MNDRAIDAHSVNCYFCNDLVDERECMPADEYNSNDGGSICRSCQEMSHVGRYAMRNVVTDDLKEQKRMQEEFIAKCLEWEAQNGHN